MIDRQAYVGLVLIIVLLLGVGAYMLLHMIVSELRSLPNDDPSMEMTVDELRINIAGEQDALLLSDSIAQQMNVDSLKRHVQIETRPVYRPPRKNDEWYITQREWKSIWKNYRIWRKMKHENEEEQK